MADALPGSPVPPEWVPLAAVPAWIARRYGVEADTVAADLNALTLAVRRGTEPRHRIPPITADHSSMYGRSLPPGLAEESFHNVRRVFVTNWESAKANWIDGTVGGRPKADGTRERLLIEVAWEAVEDFAELRLRRWKRQDAVPALSTPAPTQPAIEQTDFATKRKRWQALVEQHGGRDAALDAWATSKVRNKQLPGHEKLTKEHAAEFGPIVGISDTTMRGVRPRLLAAGVITEQSAQGGARMHEKHRTT